jgi:hypothetical protein
VLVPHDADDLVPDGVLGGHPVVRDALSHRVLAGKVFPGKGLIDQHHQRSIGLVAPVEHPAPDEGNAQRFEVALIGSAMENVEPHPFLGPPRSLELAGPARPGEGQLVHGSDSSYSGAGLESFREPVLKGQHLVPFGVA